MPRLVPTRQRRTAPLDWQNPDAVNDSVSGGQVGVGLVVLGTTLKANDTFDSRGSITILNVSNPVGCTVALDQVQQKVTVTPTQQSPCTWQYTIIDTQAFTDTATVTMTGVTAGTTVTQKMLGYVKPGSGGTVAGFDDVYGVYGFARFREFYREPWDSNLDGVLDTNFRTSSSFTNAVNGINNAAYTYVALDWEVGGFESELTGHQGASAQQAALNDALALVAELKSRCPSKKFGWYWIPKQTSEASMGTPMLASLAATPTTLDALWKVIHFISPDIYQRFKIIESGSTGSQQITASTDLDRMTNMANLCLECAEHGTNVEVFPHVSNYYLSTAAPLNNTKVPLDEMYRHIKRFSQTTRNGKRPAGVMWWHGGGSTFVNLVEADLKAMYQAINLLPYDPNMPRPA